MTVKDLNSMSLPQTEEKRKIEQLLKEIDLYKPRLCFQCTKCTSGCEAMKLLELEPHSITALAKMGYIDELLNSDIIWTCVTCYKCKQRCPQKVSPVDILYIV
jgi:heterodisulfide reductase subunit C